MTLNAKDISTANAESQPDYIGTEGGVRLFQLASNDVVSQITKKDSRVGYCPLREKWFNFIHTRARQWQASPEDNLSPDAAQQQAWSGFWAMNFAKDRIDKIQTEIGRPVYVRGVATYLDAEVDGLRMPENKFILFGPATAVKLGRERKEMQNVPTHVVGDERIMTWVKQTIPWLFKHPQDVRGELEKACFKEQAGKVFPMVIFFDGDPNYGGYPIRAEIFDYLELPMVYDPH